MHKHKLKLENININKINNKEEENINEKEKDFFCNLEKNVFERLNEPGQVKYFIYSLFQFRKKNEKLKHIQKEEIDKVSYTPKINDVSKKFNRSLSDLFDWEKKKKEKNEINFENRYGKEKKKLIFTTKSSSSFRNIEYVKESFRNERNNESIKR